MMKHNRELAAYQKMLGAILRLTHDDPRATSIPILKFLKIFNKYWNKFYAKEFRN